MPKCEIFILVDSRDFYTKKPPWVGDFGIVMKKSKLFRFRHDFEVFSRENFELVHAETALKKYFLRVRSKIKKSIMVVFEPICKFPKRFFKIFTLWVFFTCFKKFENL